MSRRGHISSRLRADGSLSWLYKTTVEIDGGGRCPTGKCTSTGVHRHQIMRSGFRTRKEAEAALTAKLAASDTGTLTEPSKMPYAAWFREWIDSRTDIKPGTRRSYEHTFATLVGPHIGHVKLSDLRGTRLGRLWRGLLDHGGRKTIAFPAGKPLAPNSVLKAFIVVSGSLEAARKEGLIARNPASDVRPPRSVPKARPASADDDDDDGGDDCWTEAQADAFLGWCDVHRPQYATLWRVYTRTGCRRGELLALRWRHVTADDIFIRQSANPGDGYSVEFGDTKNLVKRHVDHYRDTLAILTRHKQNRGGRDGHLDLVRPNALVFADLNGKPFHPLMITQRFARDMAAYRTALGDDAPVRIRLHGLRHAHGSHLLIEGMSETAVARRLGHTVATLQRVYAHALRGSQKMWFDRIEARYTDGYTGSQDGAANGT